MLQLKRKMSPSSLALTFTSCLDLLGELGHARWGWLRFKFSGAGDLLLRGEGGVFVGGKCFFRDWRHVQLFFLLAIVSFALVVCHGFIKWFIDFGLQI